MSENEPGIEKEVLKSMIETWKKYPDMRLIQLIVNATASLFTSAYAGAR